jgi:hypothetical protein
MKLSNNQKAAVRYLLHVYGPIEWWAVSAAMRMQGCKSCNGIRTCLSLVRIGVACRDGDRAKYQLTELGHKIAAQVVAGE